MFGIDDILLASLVGGGLGAITNRKNPLQGALMGAGLGAGGAALPGLLGMGGAAGSAAGAAGSAAGTAGNAAVNGMNWGALSEPAIGTQAAAPIVDMGTHAGLFDTLNFKSGGLLNKAADMGKPLGTALNAAQTVKGMMPQQQPFQMPPPPQLPMNKPDLSALLNYGQQQQQYDAQDELRKRALMQKYINGIGGGYGTV